MHLGVQRRIDVVVFGHPQESLVLAEASRPVAHALEDDPTLEHPIQRFFFHFHFRPPDVEAPSRSIVVVAIAVVVPSRNIIIPRRRRIERADADDDAARARTFRPPRGGDERGGGAGNDEGDGEGDGVGRRPHDAPANP